MDHLEEAKRLFLDGLALQEKGSPEQAEFRYRKALDLAPGRPSVMNNLAAVFIELKKYADARILCERLLETNPEDEAALLNLGNCLLKQNSAEEALLSYDKALGVRPEYPDALNSRGSALLELKRLQEALESCDRALAVKPDYAEALNNRGNVLLELRRPGEALESYERALAVKPYYAEALYNRGGVLVELNRPVEALASYDRALAIKPDHAETLNNRGYVLLELGRPQEALASFDHALALRPDNAEALNNRGSALMELKREEDALGSYDRALAIRPDYVEALNNRAVTLLGLGRRDEAQECCRQALAFKPDDAEARWLHVMAVIPLVFGPQENPATIREEFSRELAELDAWFDIRRMREHEVVGRSQPFCLAYQEENNRDLLSRYGALCVRIMKCWRDGQAITSAIARRTSVIRVGIVSAHVRNHSVWNAIVKGWLQHIDRNRFEIHVFHLGIQKDGETAWASSHSTSFEQGVRGVRQWLDAIEAKHPDVLIYPEVGMDPMTVKLASLRLAPVQIATWGHPETTGLPTMDYYLTAEAYEPPGAREHYTEELVALPRLGCCYTPSPLTAGNPDLAGLGIGSGAPIILCPGTPFKYAPQHDSVLIGIARKLGRCQFVFFVSSHRGLSEKLRQRLIANFARSGLNFRDYGVFVPWQARSSYYGLMRRADIMLDTIGFSGFNTAMQAVECGLPIVTREGRFMRGRLASGILRTLGISELIAGDEDAYIDLAVKLSSDAQYRQHIRQRIENSRDVLFGDAATVRALEDFLTRAAQRN